MSPHKNLHNSLQYSFRRRTRVLLLLTEPLRPPHLEQVSVHGKQAP